METRSIELIKLVHPLARDKALAAYTESVQKTPVGVHPLITQTRRTFAEQDHIYAQGRTLPGNIVSYAKAGQSYHNWDLALDFVLVIGGKYFYPKRPELDKNWMLVVNIFKAHGFEAGIDWPGKKKDAPHFEMRFGYHWSELMKLPKDKDGYVIITPK